MRNMATKRGAFQALVFDEYKVVRDDNEPFHINELALSYEI
jgi:hypothetical protein